MSHHILLILHIIAATIWIGGHLYLCICILPKVLHKKNADELLKFEKAYAPLGLTALAVLITTGIWMALKFGITPRLWFSFISPLEKVVSIKLLLLLLTISFAISAQIRVIPKLKQGDMKKLIEMVFHIIGITFIGITMLVLGTFVRYGGI